MNEVYLQYVCTIARKVLLSCSRNDICVVIFNADSARVAYPRCVESLIEARSSGFMFEDPHSIIEAELAIILRDASMVSGASPSTFDAIRSIAFGSSPQLSQALTKCICTANKCMVVSRSLSIALRVPLHSSILVLGPGGDFSDQYMNASFDARSMSVKIDCISTGAAPAPMLEQLADVTGEFYLQISFDATESQVLVTLALLCAADSHARSSRAVPNLVA